MKKFFSNAWFYLWRFLPFAFLVLASIFDGLGDQRLCTQYLFLVCFWFLFDIRDDLKEFCKSSGKKSVD